MTPYISVIVPVYRVEPYLDRCVQSIIGQTLKNIEIILVDDGSPDCCPEMCDRWALTDSRIRVIHKENAGLGYARNTGMDIATGDAICFVDSDDFLQPSALEKSYTAMKRENADTVCFGFQRIDANGRMSGKVIPSPVAERYSGTQVQKTFLPNLISPDPKTGYDFHISMSAWSELFSRKMIEINHWRFVSEREIISEDIYSLLILYRNVKKVVILPEALYCYCEDTGSLTHTYRSDRYSKIVQFYSKAVSLCAECGFGSNVANRLKRPFLANTMAAMKMIQQSTLTPRAKREELQKICHDSVMCNVLINYSNRSDTRSFRLFWTAVKHDWRQVVRLMLIFRNILDSCRLFRH